MTVSSKRFPVLDRALRFAGAATSWAVDLILPPTCPVTGETVSGAGYLSASAWTALRFIDDPVCAKCGAPFVFDHGDGAECGACIALPPAFDSARAAIVYDEASHRLVIGFKHSDRTELAPMFVRFLARVGGPYFRDGALLVPTPLHPRRLLARRYNQAGLLAQGLGRETGLPVLHRALRRIRSTPPQTRLTASARRRNVAAAFAVRPAFAPALAGARIVLVDDVMTTGATLSACARALRRAGAARIDALVLARTVRDGFDGL